MSQPPLDHDRPPPTLDYGRPPPPPVGASNIFGGAFGVLDERKAPCAAGLAIERANDLCWLPDLREMRTQILFGCLIGQVAHEQSDWWHV